MTMPRGIQFILMANSGVLMLYLAVLIFYSAALRVNYPAALYIALVTTGTLLVQIPVLLFRWQRLTAFVRLMIYVLAILQGLQVMLVIKDVFTLAGSVLVISGALLAFYFIGMRGYLASVPVSQYFSHQS